MATALLCAAVKMYKLYSKMIENTGTSFHMQNFASNN